MAMTFLRCILPLAVAVAVVPSPSPASAFAASASRGRQRLALSFLKLPRGGGGRYGGGVRSDAGSSALFAASSVLSTPVEVPTQPIEGMKPGTSGLRKKVEVWQGLDDGGHEHYVENFIQSLIDTAAAKNGGKVPETCVYSIACDICPYSHNEPAVMQWLQLPSHVCFLLCFPMELFAPARTTTGLSLQETDGTTTPKRCKLYFASWPGTAWLISGVRKPVSCRPRPCPPRSVPATEDKPTAGLY